jgi:hypothetical protein
MEKKRFWLWTPTIVTTLMALAFMLVWTFWGIAELYHEGWHGNFFVRLVYLIPGTIFLLLTLAVFKWQRGGGWATIVIGVLFTVMWFDPHIVDGKLTVDRNWNTLWVSGSLAVIGGLFLLDVRLRQKFDLQIDDPNRCWGLRRPRLTLAFAAYGLMIIIVSAINLPRVLTRVDDGDRSARLIEGNGITLIWAPEGPGWNYKQEWGGYPSWRMVAFYGKPPVGLDDDEKGDLATAEDMAETNLCRYLSEDGLTLLDTPQDIWRMPTVDELARSLVRDGESAGCSWQGEVWEQMECEVTPDKETPLWDPTAPPIYYWAFELYDEEEAYFVSYNGWVNTARQMGGNPRHSYRCVREP